MRGKRVLCCLPACLKVRWRLETDPYELLQEAPERSGPLSCPGKQSQACPSPLHGRPLTGMEAGRQKLEVSCAVSSFLPPPPSSQWRRRHAQVPPAWGQRCVCLMLVHCSVTGGEGEGVEAGGGGMVSARACWWQAANIFHCLNTMKSHRQAYHFPTMVRSCMHEIRVQQGRSLLPLPTCLALPACLGKWGGGGAMQRHLFSSLRVSERPACLPVFHS